RAPSEPARAGRGGGSQGHPRADRGRRSPRWRRRAGEAVRRDSPPAARRCGPSCPREDATGGGSAARSGSLRASSLLKYTPPQKEPTMAENQGERLVRVPPSFAEKARIGSKDRYRALYDRSLSDPDGFWAEQAERIHWFKRWEKVTRWDFKTAKIEWFIGGKTNVAYNCLDRHVAGPRKNKAALIWEGDSPEESRVLTYQDVLRETS